MPLALLLLASPPASLWGQQASFLPYARVPSMGPGHGIATLDRPLAFALQAARTPYLALDARNEGWLLTVAGRFSLATEGIREPVRRLPLAGLDPSGIRWSFDRGFAGRSDRGAGRMSDHLRSAAVLYPVVLSAFTARSSERWRDMAVGGVVYAEALLITSSATRLAKTLIGRPRPGAYLARPDPAAPESVGAGVFHSMPSSHASTAWTGVSVALTSHLLLRPRARGAERFTLGFVGGALAGAASALRVRGGAHFPSDVVAGAGIGMASGVLVPLAHRGDRPLPSREAWLQIVVGTLAGTAVGVLVVSRAGR